MYEHMWLIFVVPTCNYLSFITRNRVFDFKIMQYFMKKSMHEHMWLIFVVPTLITFLLLLETEFLSFELTVNKEVLKVAACSFPLMLALN